MQGVYVKDVLSAASISSPHFNNSEDAEIMSSHHDAHVRLQIQARCVYYKYALFQRLTPLFRQIVLQASEYHQAAIALPHIHQDLADGLNRFHNELEHHWFRIHVNFEQHALLLRQVTIYQEILASQLLSDYAGVPTTPEEWEKHASVIREHRISTAADVDAHEEDEDNNVGRVAGRKEDSEYHKFVFRPLEELMLDVEHVEDVMLAATDAAAQEGGQGSRIGHFIEQCDWAGLAKNLWKDRALLVDLCRLAVEQDQDNLSHDLVSLNRDTAMQIMRGLNQVKNKYFADLSSPTTFTLSKYATEFSLPTGTGRSAAAETESGPWTGHEKKSLWHRVKDIADSIRGFLGDLPAHGRSSIDAEKGTWEEIEPLLQLKAE